jgi:general secretion pathway protein A
MREATQTFFGMSDPAFTRPPRMPYVEPTRKAAFDQLDALIRRRGFAVLTAPPGCGKTALLHYLTQGLNDNEHQVTYVPFSFLEQGHMLQFIATQMGLQEKRGMAVTLRQIHKHLNDIQPVTPVIILDEVERLEVETMRMVRLIANDRPDTAHHCTLILAGTESFVQQKLCLHVNEPLRQRITLYARLRPLDQRCTGEYINHHLSQAGVTAELFEVPAVQLIHELSNGVPRLINTLAESALDIAAEQQQRTVSLDHVQHAAEWALPPQVESMHIGGR